MNDATREAARYPLRAVMRRTGLSADVLRAWERRYGAIAPSRSQGGQRLYSDDDVERLVLLQRATAAGHSISEIARLDRSALESLTDRPSRIARESVSPDAALRDALSATEVLDPFALEAALKRAALSAGMEPFVDELLPHFLRTVGDRWHRGSITPAHEHLATQAVRRVLAWITDAYEAPPTAPRIVVATPATEYHELGAMLAAAAAAGEGWRVLYLGANLPAADIVAAASQIRASVVALSVVYADGESVATELRAIAAGMPAETMLLVGGVGSIRLDRILSGSGARVLPDLDSLRVALRERRQALSPVAAS